MSESTMTVVSINVSSPTESAGLDVGAAHLAAEAEARREAEEREAAEKTRQEAARAFRRGELAYRAGLLEAGRLSAQYIRQRLALGDQRAAAVQALEGAFAPWSSAAVDVNRLVRVWEAFRLLAVEQGLAGEGRKQGPADAVPYGHWRDAWARLVERQGEGTRQETYILLPGLEEECRTLFREAVQGNLSREACADKVAALVREHAARQAEAERQRAEEAAAKARAEQEAAARAADELRAAQDAKVEAEAEAKVRGDAATAEAMNQAAAALEEKQRAMLEAHARAEAAERQRRAAERAAKERAEAERRAAEKAAARAAKRDRCMKDGASASQSVAPREHGKAAQADEKRGTVTGNLLRVGRAATAPTVAEMIAELLRGCDDAAAVLRHLGRAMDWKPKLGTALVEGLTQAGAVRTLQAMYLAIRQADARPSDAGASAPEAPLRAPEEGAADRKDAAPAA